MPDDMVGQPFEADLEVGDGMVVVAFRGELDLAARGAAAAALASALSAHPQSIVVDLRDVSYMDATGVSCLITARSLADTLGRRITLLNGSGQPQRVLTLTGLIERFEIVEDLRQLTT
jgi:anti-sigma B factor antagonist